MATRLEILAKNNNRTPEEEIELQQIKKEKSEQSAIKERKEALQNRRLLAEEEEKAAILAQAKNPVKLGEIKVDMAEVVANIKNELLLSAKQSQLINPQLSKLVKLYPKQLLLMAAKTGKGKSTMASKVAEKLEADGKRVLFISNEESQSAVYRRLACTRLGYDFKEFSENRLSSDITQRVLDAVPTFSQVTVIDAAYRPSTYPDSKENWVVDADRLMQVLNEEAVKYDAVIIDYYQKIVRSYKHPGWEDWQAQAQFVVDLDTLKNTLNGPIVIFAQLKTETDSEEFEDRLKGRKKIFEVCTDALEIRAKSGVFMAQFKCHKSRFNGHLVSKSIVFGFDKDTNHLVNFNDPTFQAKVVQWQKAIAADDIVDDVPDDEEDTGSKKSYKPKQQNQAAYDLVSKIVDPSYAGGKLQGKSVEEIYASINSKGKVS